MTGTKDTVSLAQRIRASRRPEMEPEVEDREAGAAFAEVRAPRTRGREALMLEVRKVNGRAHLLPYAYMLRADFWPGDRLVIHFASAIVKVEGRQLRPLYKRLGEHRVGVIQEGTEAEEGLKPEEAAHIDVLELTDPTEERYES